MTQDQLEAKKEQLDELEKSEREAKRLEEALSQGRVSTLSASRTSRADGDDNNDAEEGASDSVGSPQPAPSSLYLPPHPGPNPIKRRAPGMGLLSALSYTLHGMMDVDPETARRNNISKTRETISQVCTVALSRWRNRTSS